MTQELLTHDFKKRGQGQRAVSTERGYPMGMQSTDRPLPVGFMKLLMNYDIKQRGEILRPRGGFQTLHDLNIVDSNKKHYLHHVGVMYIKDTSGLGDAFLRRYMLLGPKHTDNTGILFSEAQVVIEDPTDETLIKSTLNAAYVADDVLQFKDHSNWKKMHDTDVHNPHPVGVVTHLDGNPYMLHQSGYTRLEVEWDGFNYTHTLVDVEPYEVNPTQAVNYGYNMLDPQPYHFDNQEKTALTLHGVLPYGKDGKLKTNAKVGQDITFKLVYDYPTGAPTYKVQWEIQDTTTKDTPTVLQKVADSPTYTAGDNIEYTTQPTFKNFSIICKVYASADTLEPLKVMILASYHLTTDTNAKSTNLELKSYDLTKARDMCTWQNQVVVWGVPGAATTVFISDINDPSYFPFPQQAEPYSEEIIKCVPYLESKLLVFTATGLHMLERNEMGILISRGIQQNLDLRTYDAEAIKVVRNMVYFKSDNYFYMIVPNNNSGVEGALQLAPISENISLMLDKFESHVAEIIDEVYNLPYTLGQPTQDISFELQSYYNYLDNNKIHNVYKYKIVLANADDIDVEFHMLYDSMQRNWTLYVVQCNDNLLVPYQRVVTEGAIYANVYSYSGDVHVQLVRQNPHDAQDTFHLDGRVARMIKNYQMFDTGKRDLSGSVKKRYREVRFEVNNLEQVDLNFHEQFIIDDDVRNPIFKHTVVHETDTQSPNFGLIYVQREYQDPVLVKGASALGTWTLGASQFPPQTVMQTRIHTSGKGYYPRFKLLSMNERMYELLTIGWVYRMMNAR